jgi:hypothetical protein
MSAVLKASGNLDQAKILGETDLNLRQKILIERSGPILEHQRLNGGNPDPTFLLDSALPLGELDIKSGASARRGRKWTHQKEGPTGIAIGVRTSDHRYGPGINRSALSLTR